MGRNILTSQQHMQMRTLSRSDMHRAISVLSLFHLKSATTCSPYAHSAACATAGISESSRPVTEMMHSFQSFLISNWMLIFIFLFTSWIFRNSFLITKNTISIRYSTRHKLEFITSPHSFYTPSLYFLRNSFHLSLTKFIGFESKVTLSISSF